MNRLTPLITRRGRSEAAFNFPPAGPHEVLEQASVWLEDAKLFAFGWVAGLVVFGTLFA
jgi:hypothetical protein